jgi:hypothetical protein
MPHVRLGIIANTGQVSTLPITSLENAFRHVDAILHAGDTGSLQALDQLAGIAPVLAVRGDQDVPDPQMPLQRVLAFNHVRIGLTHGDRHPWIENYFRFQRYVRGHGTGSTALFGSLLRRFEPAQVDAIVFGHPSIPFAGVHRDVQFFNPGAIYSDPGAFLRSDQLTPPSTVGILEIMRDRSIHTRWVDLPALAPG